MVIEDNIVIRRYSRKPSGYRRELCRISQCRKAQVRGGLCQPCGDRVLAIVNDRFCLYGIRQTSAIAITVDGYINVKWGKRMVPEHRVIVANVLLKREFRPGENVHHKNGCRTDNRIENLELWNVSQPAGQRPEDKMVWAKEIIGLYGTVDDIFSLLPLVMGRDVAESVNQW